MIEKSRLEELIEQGATIYSTYWKEEVDLSLPCEFKYDSFGIEYLIVYEDENHSPSYGLENLTEDIEGAKWEEEFGCIERTERLLLPTWEEFKNKKIKCVCFTGKSTNCLYEMFIDKKDRIQLYDHDCEYNYFNKKATKENYTLACRKAKELFLGEKENV